MLGVANDDEFDVLLKDVVFPDDGKNPHIEPILLPKATNSRKTDIGRSKSK